MNQTLIGKALWDLPDKIVVASVEPGVYGQAIIVGKDWGGRATHSIPLESTTLDVILAAIGEIALVKLDLEGAEAAALRGAANSINPTNSIIFESWATEGGEATSLLRQLGFQVAGIDGRCFFAFRGTGEPRA